MLEAAPRIVLLVVALIVATMRTTLAEVQGGMPTGQGEGLLTLRVEPTTVEAHIGQPIRVTLILRNNAPESVGRLGGNPSLDYKYVIEDETGQRVRFTRPLPLALSGGPFVIVLANSALRIPVSLDKFMALDRVGKYTMTVSTVFKPLASSGRMWGDRPIHLTSNTIKIVVLQQRLEVVPRAVECAL